MPRHSLQRGSKTQMARVRHKILDVRLTRDRYALAAQKRAREKTADADLDYDHPALNAARQHLRGTRIEAEVERINREITAHLRNGGAAPTDKQRAASQEADDERRGWAMVEQILREQS